MEASNADVLGAPIQTGMADLGDGLTIRYCISGRGDTAVVLVPGWTMPLDVYEHQLAHFAESSSVRIVTYDPRGQGASTKTTDGHTPEQHARDLAGLIEHLELGRVVLVGWSNGGGDVLEYVRLSGIAQILGLMLLDACPRTVGDSRSSELVWYGRDVLDEQSDLKAFLYDVAVDRAVYAKEFASWMLDDQSEDRLDVVAAMSLRTPTTIAVTSAAAWLWLDNTSEVERLEAAGVPLSFFMRDEFLARAREWANIHAPSASVDGFGKHMMFWEHPDRFNPVLEAFVAACTGAPSLAR